MSIFTVNKNKPVIIAIPKEKLHYIKYKNINLSSKNMVKVKQDDYPANEYNFYKVKDKEEIIIEFHENDVKEECVVIENE